jgi:hypothetical protein
MILDIIFIGIYFMDLSFFLSRWMDEWGLFIGFSGWWADVDPFVLHLLTISTKVISFLFISWINFMCCQLVFSYSFFLYLPCKYWIWKYVLIFHCSARTCVCLHRFESHLKVLIRKLCVIMAMQYHIVDFPFVCSYLNVIIRKICVIIVISSIARINHHSRHISFRQLNR